MNIDEIIVNIHVLRMSGDWNLRKMFTTQKEEGREDATTWLTLAWERAKIPILLDDDDGRLRAVADMYIVSVTTVKYLGG